MPTSRWSYSCTRCNSTQQSWLLNHKKCGVGTEFIIQGQPGHCRKLHQYLDSWEESRINSNKSFKTKMFIEYNSQAFCHVVPYVGWQQWICYAGGQSYDLILNPLSFLLYSCTIIQTVLFSHYSFHLQGLHIPLSVKFTLYSGPN